MHHLLRFPREPFPQFVNMVWSFVVNNRKILVGALTAVALVAAISVWAIFFRGWIPTSFVNLVPDAVVEATVQAYAGGMEYSSPSAGRFAVFENTVCPHYLDKEEIAKKGGEDGDSCWKFLYAAYSGGDWYFNNDFPGRFSPKKQEEISGTRDTIMEIARAYLRNPDRLHTFYMGYRGIALDATHKMSPERRAELVQTVAGFVEGMKLSKDPNIFALRKDGGLRFALRRWDEGKDPLRDAWIKIGENFLDALKSQN